MFKKYFIHTLFSVYAIGAYSASPWALTDLEFVKKMLEENHPGMHNAQDPAFAATLEISYQTSKNALEAAPDVATCIKALTAFTAPFKDPHLTIQFPVVSFNPALVYPFKKEPFSITCIEPHICWVRIPTFESNTSTIPDFEKLAQTLPTIRQTPYIIFDVRGNTGGSTFWGEQIVYALFGKEYINYQRTMLTKREYVEWRASANNIAYWENTIIPFMNDNFPQDSKEAVWAHASLEGLKNAHAKGKPYYRENPLPEANSLPNADPLYAGTVLIIIDEFCNSACLDFIDEVVLMAPRVILVGRSTAADSAYAEVRTMPLPSKKGIFNFPIKVVHNRVRGHNEPHKPDFAYTGDIYDTQALQQYVRALIQQNLTVLP